MYIGFMSHISKGIAFSLLLLAAGCATPEARISRNPEVFAAFPADAQALIRKGQVAIGFTKPMVEMAIGRPSVVSMRQTAEGDAEIWQYIDYDRYPSYRHVPIRHYYRDSRGRVYTVHDFLWVDDDVWYERQRLRLEFRDGKLAAIEGTP